MLSHLGTRLAEKSTNDFRELGFGSFLCYNEFHYYEEIKRFLTIFLARISSQATEETAPAEKRRMAQETELRKALERLAGLFARGEIAPEVYAQQHQELLAQLTHTLASPHATTEQTYEGWHLPPHNSRTAETETSDDWLSPLSNHHDVSKMLTPLPHMGTEVLSIPEELSTPPPLSQNHQDSRGSWKTPQSRWTPPLHVGDIIRNRYRIQKQLSLDSMGPLFRVEDTRFGGTYAIRILNPKIASNDSTMERWLSILQTHHTLNHPGLARTYLVDEDSQQNLVFYLREDVPGQTLETYLEDAQEKSQAPFSLEQSLTLFQALVSIVDYAHKREHFHLDLVPCNIVVTESSEDSIPLKLLDFLFQPEQDALSSRSTPTNNKHKNLFYRAPEQLFRESIPTVEGHCFALGVLLYQMLTGSLPVAMAQTPSEANSQIPEAVDKVLRRAMNPRAEKRHSSVKELLNDVMCLFPARQQQQPSPSANSWSYLDTSSAPVSHELQQISSDSFDSTPPPESTKKTPLPKSSPPASMSKAAHKPQPNLPSRSPHQHNFPSSPGSFHPTRSKPKAQSSNVPRLPGASPSRADSTHPYTQQRPTTPPRSKPTFRSPNTPSLSTHNKLSKPFSSPKTPIPPSRSRDNLHGSERKSITNADRIARLRAGQTPLPRSIENTAEPVSTQPPLNTLQGHTQGITALAAQPQGQFLASASLDGTLRLWDTQSWYPLYQIQVQGGTPCNLHWNKDGSLLLYSTSDGTLHLQDLQRTQPVWTRPSSSPCVRVQWHPKEHTFFTAFANGELAGWTWDGKTVSQLWTAQTNELQAMSFSHASKQLVTCSSQSIETWNAANGQRLHNDGLPSDNLDVLCSSPQSTTLLLGGHSGEVLSWDIAHHRFVRHWHGHQQAIRSLVVPSHDQWFASASSDQKIHLWSWQQEQPLCSFTPQQGSIRALTVAPQGQWLASGGAASTVCIWDTSIWNSSSTF